MAKKKGLLQEIEGKSGSFALIFLVLFGLTFGFLALVGATPDSSTDSTDLSLDDATPAAPTATPQNVASAPGQSSQTSSTATTGALPTRVVAKNIGLDVTVANPTSTDVDVLDQYLLKGALRYPTSQTLGVNGTVVLFGHSSYLPIVHNQAYKSFDGVQNLKNGDIISIYAGTTEYQFSVTGVKVANATNDIVPLPQDGQHLTLVTCDSFATESNRFIVTADRVN